MSSSCGDFPADRNVTASEGGNASAKVRRMSIMFKCFPFLITFLLTFLPPFLLLSNRIEGGQSSSLGPVSFWAQTGEMKCNLFLHNSIFFLARLFLPLICLFYSLLLLYFYYFPDNTWDG